MTLRIGLIGAGAAVTELHLPGYQQDPRAQVKGVWSRTARRAQDLAETIEGADAFDDVADLLQAVDAVSICTPPSTHRPLTELAVEASVHVLLEKPVAHTLVDTLALRELALTATTVLEVMRNERFMDLNLAAKQLIEEGAVGELLSLQFLNATSGLEAWTGGAAWTRDPEMTGGGALLDLAVHKLDLACWMTGAGVADGQAQAAISRDEDAMEKLGVITVPLHDRTLVSVAASWRGPEDESVMIAAGTDRLLTAEGSSGRIFISGGGRVTTKQTVAPWSPQDNSARATIAGFVDACVADELPEPDAWWDDATRAVLQGYACAVVA